MEKVTKQIIELLPFKPGDKAFLLYKPLTNGKWYTKPVTVVGVSLSVKKEGNSTVSSYYYIVQDNEKKNIAAYITELYTLEPIAIHKAIERNMLPLAQRKCNYKASPHSKRDESIIGDCDTEYKDRRGGA